MAADMKIYIKVDDGPQLQRALTNIQFYGRVEEKFDFRSVNFLPSNNENLDQACDMLDELGVKYELL